MRSNVIVTQRYNFKYTVAPRRAGSPDYPVSLRPKIIRPSPGDPVNGLDYPGEAERILILRHVAMVKPGGATNLS